MTDRRLYLGRVERVVPNDPHGPIAQLRPFYEAAPNSLSWQRPLSADDARQEFPNRGLVTWFGRPDTAREGTVWQFRVEEQRTFDRAKPHHDAFKVAAAPAPTPPVEIVDLRGIGDEEQIRLRVTQEGLELSFVPSARIYLWVDDGCWIGPVHLVESPKPGRWILDPQQKQQGILPKVQPVPTSQLARLSVGAPRLFLAPAAKAGSQFGTVDWAPDEIVLKRVLRRLRKTDRAYTDALGLTEKAIDRAVGVLSDAEALGTDLSLDLQRLRRARSIVGSLVERQNLAEDVLRELLQLPSIQAGIREVQNRVRQETEERVRAELEESVTRITELRGQQSRLEEEIAALQTTLATHADELAAKVETRLAELMARPGQALTDLAILRAALDVAAGAKLVAGAPPSTRGAGDGSVVPASLPPLPSSAAPPSGEVANLIEQAQLRQTLRRAFRARAVPTQAAKVMHAAFLAGAMPVLAGVGASRALEAYAAAVTGGRWLWVPISPAMLDAGDLLGRVDPATRQPRCGRHLPGSAPRLLCRCETRRAGTGAPALSPERSLGR
jgi:chaperonin cofactor prefoldin